MKKINEELEILNSVESLPGSEGISLDMLSYHEMDEQPVKESNVLELINNQFDQIYRENKMISFLLKEVSTHIKH